jgi:hypothetical protein
VHHAFDLQARLAEIQQEAELQAGGFETIRALHAMRVVERFDSLQLNQQCVLDQQVCKVLADQHAVVVHGDATLLHNREARRTQFMRQRVLIDFSKNPTPSVLSTVNAQPITCPDRPFSLSLSACSACIFLHLRLKDFL